MFKNQKIFVIIIPVAAITLAGWKSGFLKKAITPMPAIPTETRTIPPAPTVTATESPMPPPSQNNRVSLIIAVLARSSTILPKEDRTNAKFLRFWFYTDHELYAEYAVDGSTTASRMVFITEINGVFSRQALYHAGQNGWELLEGKDALLTKPQKELYSYDTKLQMWIKAN